MVLLPDEAAIGKAIATKRLTPEDSLQLYVDHGGMHQKETLLMRGTSLRSCDCAICLCDVGVDEAVMCSECRVGYHPNCMRKWLGNAKPPTCPTCRKVLGS